MKLRAVLFLIALLFCYASAQGPILPVINCSASAIALLRPGAWPVWQGTGVIFDLQITNNGSCPLTEIGINIDLAAGAYINGQYWGMTVTLGEESAYVLEILTLYTPLPASGVLGGAYGSYGFVAIFDSDAVTVPSVSSVLTACQQCVPTSAPTNSPTNLPTIPPTNPPASCAASFTLTKRAGGAFQEYETPAQIWDLVFNNTGVNSVSTITISITPPAGTLVDASNYWSLQYVSGSLYNVELHNSLYLSGAAYTGAGFVIDGATNSAPTVVITNVIC